jgi:hypothetical protein
MRVYVIKTFRRFQRKEHISDAALREAVDRAEEGLADADLGGGLIKQRIAREGQGAAAAIGRSSLIELESVPCFFTASPRTSARISIAANWHVGGLWGGLS